MSGKGSKKRRPPAKRRGPASAPGARGGGAPPTGPPGEAGGTPAPGAARKPTQAERFEAARRARRRKSRLVRAGVVGAVLVVVGVVAALVFADRRAERRDQERLTAGSCEYDTRADRLTANNHVPPPSYEVDPPAGGDHDPSPAPAGVYTAQNAPSDGRLVHSLEHGLVVVWHRPDLSEAERDDVRAVFDEHAEDVIVVPRPSLDVKVAATSWGRRLLCGEVEGATLSEFVELYRNQSPEAGVR